MGVLLGRALRSLLNSFKLRGLPRVALNSVSVGQSCRQEPCLSFQGVLLRAGLNRSGVQTIQSHLGKAGNHAPLEAATSATRLACPKQ